ncbi:phosphotransferase family protein [Microbacterium sp. GXF6406]
MSGWHGGRLTPVQAAWVKDRLPGVELVQDMSWGVVASFVVHVQQGGRDLVVKAGDNTNHHIDRELSAHPRWTADLVSTGHAARLIDSLPEERVLILDLLPGVLVEGHPSEYEADTYRQAGALLRRLHAQESRNDADYEPRANARALQWLDGEHRVVPDAAACARRILASDPAPAARVIPAHGDWQPRNWLIDGGVVRVIDFGRFGFRPASSDLTRLTAQQWERRPDLERAFFEGYGDDPRNPDRWRIDRLREAVGTACWAFQVGDEEFEAQGHRMLAEALAAF